ncbi:MAG TPA: hypothetical protein VK612_12940 [Pyrinomonadaceae bacterium]|nr:hypothetical protein [Pyrinomonadaceae bacterium]
MKKLILIAFLAILGSSNYAYGQTADCPADRVCLTVDQARQALVDSDTVKAQALEITVLDKTVSDLRDEIGRLRIELAKMTGDKTGAEQMIVRLTAIVDLLLKQTRKKCLPFSVCF